MQDHQQDQKTIDSIRHITRFIQSETIRQMLEQQLTACSRVLELNRVYDDINLNESEKKWER